jgi:Flp pilus assembly pilin Flp
MDEPTERTMDLIGRARMTSLRGLNRDRRRRLQEFLEEESGQDSMEYALLAALLSLSAVATLKTLAAEVTLLWQHLLTGYVSAV